MLRAALRSAGVAPRLRLAAPALRATSVRSLCTPPAATEPVQRLVHEEEVTGRGAGQGMPSEAELWSNPEMLVRAPPTSPARVAPSDKSPCARPTPQTAPPRAAPLAPAHAPRRPAQLPERAELWWDDGVAVPDWYIDRECWPFETSTAVLHLAIALGVIFGGVGGACYLVGDMNRPMVRRDEALPFDLKREYGEERGEDEEDDE